VRKRAWNNKILIFNPPPLRVYKTDNNMKNLIELEKERLEWSLKTFPEATPLGSLRKLESEILEIDANIEMGIADPVEYADALMCLLDAAGREGISLEEIIEAFELKLEKNKARKWKKNPDNSYSHIKE
jgi:hypothetical protein